MSERILGYNAEISEADFGPIFNRAVRLYPGLENRHIEISIGENEKASNSQDVIRLDKRILKNKGLLELALVKGMSLLSRKDQNNSGNTILEEIAAQTNVVDLHFRQFSVEQKTDTIKGILNDKEGVDQGFAEILYRSLPKKEQDLVLKSIKTDETLGKDSLVDKFARLEAYSSYDELSENIIDYLKTDPSLPEDKKEYLKDKHVFSDILNSGPETSPLDLVEHLRSVVPTSADQVRERIARGYKPDETLDNPHRSYHLEEMILLQEESNLNRQIQQLEGQLRDDKSVVDKLINLRTELGRAMELKGKLIELGWPSRHNHTNFDSDDGSLSPQELVDMAVNRGITTLYVTSHNSMGGSLEAIKYARQKGYALNILPGVEIESPFEDEKGQPFGYMHWQVIGSRDKKTAEQMEALTQEINNRLETALSLRFEKILNLTEPETFNSKATDSVIEKLKDKTAIKESKYIDPLSDTNEQIKQKLLTLFNDVRAYVQKHPRKEFLGRFLNKKNLLGKWTNKVWENDAADKRRCLRALVDSVYKDKDIEGELIAQGLLVPMRTEEVVKRFSEIGCQVSAAHPGLEISDKDVTESDFLKRAIAMTEKGFLHGAYSGYSKYTREFSKKIKELIEKIRKEASKEFKDENNNSDFHTLKESDPIFGESKKDPKGDYWTLLDKDPDRKSYLYDGRFLTRSYLERANQQIISGEFIGAMDTLNLALIANPFSKEAQGLMERAYLGIKSNGLTPEKENIEQKEKTTELDDEQAIDYLVGYIKDIKKDGPKVVVFVGGPGSGKTTLVKNIMKHFDENMTTKITVEDYLKSNRKWRLDNIENVGKSPVEKYNTEFFNKQIKQLLQLQDGQAMKLPEYNQAKGIGLGDDDPEKLNFPEPVKEVQGKQDLIIIEGDFQFLDQNLIDKIVYLDVEDEPRAINRLYRDLKDRMFDQDQKTNVEKIEASIKLRLGVQYYPFTLPWREKADLLLKVHPTPLEKPDWRHYKYSYDVTEK